MTAAGLLARLPLIAWSVVGEHKRSASGRALLALRHAGGHAMVTGGSVLVVGNGRFDLVSRGIADALLDEEAMIDSWIDAAADAMGASP
jgi:hypothetical protein